MTHCSICDDTGWMRVSVDGVSSVKPCVHKTRDKAAEDAKHPGGFRPLAELLENSPAVKAAITETDRRVAELIENCKGAAQAVTSVEIAAHLWPGSSMDPRQAEKLRRQVTESVARLRTLARIPIAASKVKPYGYFIPIEAAEWREMYERINNEAMKLHDWATLFNRNADQVRDAEGQINLSADDADSADRKPASIGEIGAICG